MYPDVNTHQYILIEKIGNRAERFHTFQRFMEKTLESADEFQEVREIIGRYDTLKQTHADLLGKQVP